MDCKRNRTPLSTHLVIPYKVFRISLMMAESRPRHVAKNVNRDFIFHHCGNIVVVVKVNK
jgi:hypothetical protein